MNDTQIRLWGVGALSTIFILGYFIVLMAVLSGNVRVPSDFKEMSLALIGVLTANVGQIVTSWLNYVKQKDA